MPGRRSSQPAAVVEAERWGELNASFLTAVFQRWDLDDQWPALDDIGRQALREKWGFDAFTLAETLPSPLGTREPGPDERIMLRARGLSFAPPAWPLLDDFMKAVRLAAKLYVEEPGVPELRGSQLKSELGLDDHRANQVIKLLDIEYWMLGSGSGDPGPDWRRELRRSCRHLLGVESLVDYLRIETEHVPWTRRAAPATQSSTPFDDEQVSGSFSLEAVPTPSPAAAELGAAVGDSDPSDIPSVFISYAHEDKLLAREFADGLTARGLQVWIDDNELLAGDSIIEQISSAVADVDFFCALVSEASHQSKWCRHELGLAMTRDLGRDGAIVIPLRVGAVEMPESIRDRLYVQFDPTDVTSAVERIEHDVRRHRERQRQLRDIGREPRDEERRQDISSSRELGRPASQDPMASTARSRLAASREAEHLAEDMLRWIRDRDRMLQATVARTREEMNARGLSSSSMHLAAQAEVRHQALHEYRDEVSRKRRRYRELVDDAAGDSSFPRFELDDSSRQALAGWRAPVTLPEMDQELPVDDPTAPALEPGLRVFERRGDGPEDRR